MKTNIFERHAESSLNCLLTPYTTDRGVAYGMPSVRRTKRGFAPNNRTPFAAKPELRQVFAQLLNKNDVTMKEVSALERRIERAPERFIPSSVYSGRRNTAKVEAKKVYAALTGKKPLWKAVRKWLKREARKG